MSENKFLKKYILSSYDLLQKYPKRRRYFHTLMRQDKNPVVVHKETNQLTYVLEGRGAVFLNGEEQKIDSGNMILIEAGIKHQFIAHSEKLILFHIHIPDEGRDVDRFIVEGEDYHRFEG